MVCGAKVSSKTDQGRLSTLRRPINKLILLELDNSDKNEQIGITFVDEANIDNLIDLPQTQGLLFEKALGTRFV